MIISRTIVDNFDRLPEDTRNELLLKIADNKDAAEYVAYAVSHNFNKLPKDTRNELLLKVADYTFILCLRSDAYRLRYK